MERCRHCWPLLITGIVILNCLALPSGTVSGQQNPLETPTPIPGITRPPIPQPIAPVIETRTASSSELKSLQEEVRALRNEVRQLVELVGPRAAKALPAPAIAAHPEPLPAASVAPRHVEAARGTNSHEKSVLQIRLRNIAAEDAEQALELVLSPSGQMASLAKTNELVMVDFPENLERALELVRKLDKTPPQVRIAIHVFELSTAAMEKLRGDASSPISKVDSVGTIEDVTPTIQSLLRTPDVKLIAQPQLMTLNRQVAYIETGDELPIQQLTQATDGAPISTTAFRSAGIRLKLKPEIVEDGAIQLDVDQDISRVAGHARNLDIPIIDRRKATFLIRLRSGQTIVIGGVRGIDQLDRREIPGTANLSPKPEYLVFLTPEVMDE